MREEAYGTRLLVDESGKEYVQKNPDSTLVSVDEITSVEDFFAKCRELFKEFAERAMKQKPVRANVEKLKRNGYTANLDFNHMYRMQDKHNLNPVFWVDSFTNRVFRTEPKAVRRGSVNLLYVGDFVYVRKKEVIYPYQDWQIKANNNTYWIINKNFNV